MYKHNTVKKTNFWIFLVFGYCPYFLVEAVALTVGRHTYAFNLSTYNYMEERCENIYLYFEKFFQVNKKGNYAFLPAAALGFASSSFISFFSPSLAPSTKALTCSTAFSVVVLTVSMALWVSWESFS